MPLKVRLALDVVIGLVVWYLVSLGAGLVAAGAACFVGILCEGGNQVDRVDVL